AMKSRINLVYLAVVGCLSAIALPSVAQISNSTQNPAPTIQTPTIDPNSVQSGFRCDTSGNVPTTMYQSSQGNQEPWIQWVSDHFSGSGWSPDARCQEVSARLETYRKNKKLRYVTLGTVNNQTVICVASKDQGPCEGIIYTLKPGQDGIKALNNLFAWRKGEEGLQSNYESATAIPYIDVGTRLDEPKAELKTTEPATPAQPNSVTNEQDTIEKSAPNIYREL
ncbi:MAG: COP23 domain-containing protein, partial [Cyanobacteria bacterium P01_A01_bin.83]